jgi:hypothetical protein
MHQALQDQPKAVVKLATDGNMSRYRARKFAHCTLAHSNFHDIDFMAYPWAPSTNQDIDSTAIRPRIRAVLV